MHTNDPRQANRLLSLPADIAEATWNGWQCIAQTLHHQRCEQPPTSGHWLRHAISWLIGNLVLVALLYFLYRFTRF